MAHWLKRRREVLGISQKDLVDALAKRGIVRQVNSISHWEAGNAIPLLHEVENAQIFADVLEWSLEELLASAYNVQITSVNIESSKLTAQEAGVLALMQKCGIEKQETLFQMMKVIYNGLGDK